MFTHREKLPAGVKIERLFDTKEIDGSTSELSFFTPNPSDVAVDNNYSQNPLPGTDNRIILGISLNATQLFIKETGNIDPVKVINFLNDGTLTLSSNQGRVQDFVHPIKDYMNFTDMKVNLTNRTTTLYSAVTLSSTGMRQTDNLFYLRPNESFTLKANFASPGFPAQSDWSAVGRFAIRAELYVASMSNAQLSAYQTQLRQAS